MERSPSFSFLVSLVFASLCTSNYATYFPFTNHRIDSIRGLVGHIDWIPGSLNSTPIPTAVDAMSTLVDWALVSSLPDLDFRSRSGERLPGRFRDWIRLLLLRFHCLLSNRRFIVLILVLISRNPDVGTWIGPRRTNPVTLSFATRKYGVPLRFTYPRLFVARFVTIRLIGA